MKRVAVYSRSRSRGAAPAVPAQPEQRVVSPKKTFRLPDRRTLVAAAGALAIALALAVAWLGPRGLNQAQVDEAIQRALEAQAPAGALTAEAYEKILPSVVHVRGLATETDDEPVVEGKPATPASEGNVGTGVVIVDNGTILTNLHVVAGAKRVRVTFADGLEAPAEVIGTRPEHDLAVLKAQKVPDDLFPATLRSTHGLRPGDPVVAVGFPFGIGPSASAGVVSGLKREYRSPEGQRILTNLIQFDAAVNPGNSGGPLVTTDGEVVGIVTGLLNPTEQRVFVGIGFAVPIENAAGAVGLNPF
ncbi:MAG TPA: trypsin-like peptidase domain-containing protein [Burkholderiales bacterium]|nr:trypsin-like peptidase domain-containing protein [Burkholderiales bacterium]